MIRKSLVWLLVFVCAFGQVKAQQFINDKIDVIAGAGQYLLNEVVYTPANFSSTKSYPLVLFFHGMGEAGTDVNKMYNTGLPQVLKSGYKPSFDFIMVAVQHNSYSLDPKYIQQVLDETMKKFNIDQSRIYLTGLSAGGFPGYGAELNIDTVLPKKFAAIVMMSGALQDANKANYSWWSIFKTPVWAVVGNNDVSYRDQNQELVNAINKQIPGLASITIRPGIGHGGWNDVYDGYVKTADGKTMWEWLYQFTRSGSGTPPPPPPPANIAPVVNAGSDNNITLPINSVTLSATASDADGSIASISWSEVSGPTQYNISSLSVLNPLLTNLAQGIYTFRVTVTDNKGATASDDVNITVNGALKLAAKYIKVNLFGGSNAYSNTEWYNWNTASSLSTGSIKYSDGTASTISATLSQQNSISDNGTTLLTTMAPSEVDRYASYSSADRSLTISGLDNSKVYDLEVYASRSGVSNNTTRFAVGSTTVDVKTDNNLTNKASFVSLTPVGGKITIGVSKLNTYNYVNGFMLTEKN